MCQSRECRPCQRWWVGLRLESGGGGGAVSVPEGPTSEVRLESLHRAGLVVASSCKVTLTMKTNREMGINGYFREKV